ncbi:MAG TPA: response regulator [Pyrinomonadaceae bacterium]|nr:response regulator [Pyrinomonadaceae bacterium]
MGRKSIKKNVFIVDKQEYWRELSSAALSAAGYKVSVFDSYLKLKENDQNLKNKPDLIIIGCAKTGVEEIELIRLLNHKSIDQLVLCTFLTSDEMRQAFKLGASDVAEKPFTPKNLINIVKESFDGFAIRNKYALNHISENL